MNGFFVGVAIITSHPKSASLDEDHIVRWGGQVAFFLSGRGIGHCTLGAGLQ